LKNKINTLKIDDSEKYLIRNLQSRESSDLSDINILTFDDSDYQFASEFSDNNVFKIGCNDSCWKNIKTCNVLTKVEEQEDLLITLISKIENTELKEEYLRKLKKTMIKGKRKRSVTTILERDHNSICLLDRWKQQAFPQAQFSNNLIEFYQNISGTQNGLY
jgi:hypothetical protein